MITTLSFRRYAIPHVLFLYLWIPSTCRLSRLLNSSNFGAQCIFLWNYRLWFLLLWSFFEPSISFHEFISALSYIFIVTFAISNEMQLYFFHLITNYYFYLCIYIYYHLGVLRLSIINTELTLFLDAFSPSFCNVKPYIDILTCLRKLILSFTSTLSCSKRGSS